MILDVKLNIIYTNHNSWPVMKRKPHSTLESTYGIFYNFSNFYLLEAYRPNYIDDISRYYLVHI